MTSTARTSAASSWKPSWRKSTSSVPLPPRWERPGEGTLTAPASEVRYQPILLKYQGRTEPVGLDEYGGYTAWRKAQDMTPGQVVEEVKNSNLKGRGGAAFPTGMKWGFVPKVEGPKYLTVNADESEPGTFKDREIMETCPHMLIEGSLIACYAFGSKTAFIYIRGEYEVAADRLEAAIAEARQAGLLGDYQVLVFRGAGAYICGEETALLESLEGRRPMPRSRPPFPAVEGLYRRPTVINNVETLANVPSIIDRGSGWYNSIGVPPRNPGPKIFCCQVGSTGRAITSCPSAPSPFANSSTSTDSASFPAELLR